MSAVANIRDRIVEVRRDRIRREGHALGVAVPATRAAPVSRFLAAPGLICEIKRRSPSKGAIGETLNPVDLAGRYRASGVRNVSILTEEDHFAGSLSDLMAVKQKYPDLAVLRKDFLLDHEDIEVSWRAGADAVLLIASILTEQELADLHDAVIARGLTPLVELHDDDDFRKARSLAPQLVGINARDLTTFDVDLLTPVRKRIQVDWPHRCVFESGVTSAEDAAMVARNRFDGLLVGEAAVRADGAVATLVRGFENPDSVSTAAHPRGDFWRRLMVRAMAHPGRPLAKICGITNRADAETAVEYGADILGFIFAESPRRADLGILADLADLDVLKAAVVVSGESAGGELASGEQHNSARADKRPAGLPDGIAEAMRDGLIDVVQFHGNESPELCASLAFPYYKTVSVGSLQDVSLIADYRCPRVLVDARDPDRRGGTGRRISDDLVRAVAEQRRLWLAGGLSHENISDVVDRYQPELVDASTRLEIEPGRKDPEKLKSYFSRLNGPRSGE